MVGALSRLRRGLPMKTESTMVTPETMPLTQELLTKIDPAFSH